MSNQTFLNEYYITGSFTTFTISMVVLALLEDIHNNLIEHECVFRDQADFFANYSIWLIRRFRLPRSIPLSLCEKPEPFLLRKM